MIIDFDLIDQGYLGQIVQVGGFVHSIRDHGGLIFVDLRSNNELMQCVFNPEISPEIFKLAEKLHLEAVVKISGVVKKRDPETINPKIKTGEIEILSQSLEVVAPGKPMPFDIHATNSLANEELRLKYRYLDLRRSRVHNLLVRKHRLLLDVRNWFDSQGFIEIQTPILANSTPEGARDYLVPSRLHPGKFYALPQAPQQFKQLLMVGGFTRYFQIAPCFRDEDPRADRHPGDFYQIDVEMAWAEETTIHQLCERFINEVLAKHSDKRLMDSKLARISFAEAMDKYGSDKPDLRYELAWQDAKPVFANSGFKVFADLCHNPKARVQALHLKNQVHNFSRSDLDRIQDIGREFGLPGIAYIQYFPEEAKSPLFKFLGDEKASFLQNFFGANTGDLILFIANENPQIVWKAQNRIRQHIAAKLRLVNENLLKFVWIDNFPMFEINEKTGQIEFVHNPFSSWQGGLPALQQAIETGTVTELVARQYDIVCNGYEVLSGGVRNTDPVAQKAAFQVVGLTEEEVESKFGHMLEAYRFGAPTHAGFAWGLDRLFMVLVGEDNIRETIAFPKNGSGMDLMMNSPSEVLPKQLKELGIQLKQ